MNNNNNLKPSPAIGNQKTMDCNTNTRQRLTQNAKAAAQDASIKGNLQSV